MKHLKSFMYAALDTIIDYLEAVQDRFAEVETPCPKAS